MSKNVDNLLTKEAKIRGYAGDPLQPKPKLHLKCPATDPPHPVQAHEIDFSNPDQLTCRLHPGVALARDP